MLELTINAVEAIRHVVARADDDIQGIRIMVSVGGCAGLQYRVGLETTAREDDEVLEFEGVRVFVDVDSCRWLTGVEVDFCDDTRGAGFVFTNPNTPNMCSCSKSFSG
jgi:iron-sulfur cluster assembly protein